MVRVIQLSPEQVSLEERIPRLIDTTCYIIPADAICEFPSLGALDLFGGKQFQGISVSFPTKTLTAYSVEHLKRAQSLAELYERIAEQEFTVVKHY